MTRKLVTLFLALAMILSLVPTMAETTDLAPVNIDWYFGQDPAPDFELVNQAVNEYLTEKINATVTFHGGTGDEYWGNMVTRINSGEDLGIIGFGSQTKLDYVVRSQTGAYYPLDGDDALLDTYGQGTKALFDDFVAELRRVVEASFPTETFTPQTDGAAWEAASSGK